MNIDDRRYLKYTEKVSPNMEVFNNLTQMLVIKQKKIKQLLNSAEIELFKTFKAI